MKKVFTLCSAVLIFASACPVTSFADQLDKETTIENQEVTDTTTEDSVTEESTVETIETEAVESSDVPPRQQPEPIPPSVPATSEDTYTEPLQEEGQSGVSTDELIIVPTEAIHFEKNQSTEEFVLKVGEQAREIGQESDLFASVMIAQAILESGSGSSLLSLEPNHNLFGIKGDYEGQFVVYGTWEDDSQGNSYTTDAAFRVYPSYKESFSDYSDLLKQGIQGAPLIYQGAWKSVAISYQNATQALTGVYATDHVYNLKLNELIETYNLTQYDHPKDIPVIEGTTEAAAEVIKTAEKYLNVPYVWGGTTPQGFDCSGLVQYVYAEALGVSLLRVTTQQETQGTAVELSEIQPGDLLFWGEFGSTYHVGIYIGGGQFIHAPEENAVVRIDQVADYSPDFAKSIPIS